MQLTALLEGGAHHQSGTTAAAWALSAAARDPAVRDAAVSAGAVRLLTKMLPSSGNASEAAGTEGALRALGYLLDCGPAQAELRASGGVPLVMTCLSDGLRGRWLPLYIDWYIDWYLLDGLSRTGFPMLIVRSRCPGYPSQSNVGEGGKKAVEKWVALYVSLLGYPVIRALMETGVVLQRIQ